MPYPLQLIDPEIVVPTVASTAVPFTVGSNFQPGDMRVVYLYWETTAHWSDGTNYSYGTLTTPTGWTRRTNGGVSYTAHDDTLNEDLTINYLVPVYTRVLQAGDTDFTATMSAAVGPYYFAVTVRNPNVGQTWAVGTNVSSAIHAPTNDDVASYVSTMNHPSVTVTANGIALLFDIAAMAAPAGGTELQVQAAGVTNLAQDASGTLRMNTVGFNTSGTSGTLQTQFGNTAYTPNYPQAICSFFVTTTVFLSQNPDVQPTMTTSPNETDAGVVVTPSIPNTQTHYVMSTSPNEVDSAPQLFSQLTGFRISPPLAIPQSPITNSVVHWDQATFADGSTVTVETSVDGGLTWQLAANDQPIPRLLPGTSVWQTVQTRVTLKRLHVTDPTPRVTNLEVRVATDASEGELVSLGLFSINNTNITITGGTTGGSSGSGGGGQGVTGAGGGASGGGLSIEISGVDMSRSVSRNAWEDVYFVPAGTNYATAIHDIIEDRLPGTQYNFASTTHKTPKLIFGMSMDSDPWQDASDLATAIGMELFFDALGVCTLRDIPDPGTGQSVWTFSDSSNPTIASATRSLTDQTVFNYIVAYGESVDNAVPVSAVSFDDNPNSPTYYLGPYGKVPTSFTSPQITTVEQAQSAADALLNLSIGNAENVELSVVPNPAIEPGDVITVSVGELKLSGTFMVNDVQMPLSAAEAMTLTVYRQSN